MKIIFLDFDGVLNNSTSLFYRMITAGPNTSVAAPDPMCVAMLDHIIDKTKAFIVVSSSWRQGRTVNQLKAILRDEFKLRNWDRVIGKTIPNDRDQSRGDQISFYDMTNVSHYLILDDNSDMLDSQKDHFVQTDFLYGLRSSHIERCFEILDY